MSPVGGGMSPLDDGLAGARVLVTGAAGGIGAAVADAFVEAGSAVVASDVAGLPRDSGARATVRADLRSAADRTRLLAATAEELGGLDVVAHLAGVLRRREIDEVTEDDWDLQHDVNLKASFFLLRDAAELMRRQGTGGRLVAATSQGWWSGGYGGSSVYAASKGGLVSLCRGLARTYGPAGITVNTVAPGAVDTAMLTDDLSEQALAGIVSATPLGRLGTAQEVASAVLFLGSARASFVTAATLNVSGGWLAY
ncbi:SDR family NAD(P)-dependent oxidoreductase [Streptomyces triticagri]|uniref:SDR family NAD(P)-dependent oxidoreductase n=1 Tax=Streptomyces triticagri TaxID=2293568 RepID=A0A372LYY0_9ACTN|nr:SDR family oxidoreductase [Streptomyces triticagri]RFU83898.1 SDR family NAD(P)-dependent oxidoreductase [Streptomyces triticagri]